jgi:hypothetical protein
MDVIRTRQSRPLAAPDEPQRTPPRCCPFCLTETLLTSWDCARQCIRYQCSDCFEVFGRLSAAAGPDRPSGRLVDLQAYREARSAKERG